ncbi:MAG: tryptophan--tRNA ligase [Verrucomicrobiales bacterium]
MRILSGIQPSGQLHIGNYFGAMRPMIDLQDDGDGYYFIADYHAMTTVSDPAILRANVREVALDFLACGLDPAKAVFFRQSDIPEVNELAWVLSTLCPMGLLERCHSFKDKTARGIPATHGLFAYPVLMAADILLYDSRIVPVGKDQKQHVEVTRDLAGKLNERFGEGTVVVPEPRIQEATAVVPGLDGQKMSKSYGNTVPLFGEEKALRKSIMRMPTDSTPVEEPKPKGNSILLQLYKLFATPEEYAAMEASFDAGGTGYGHYKGQLFEAYWEHFRTARECRAGLAADPGHVESVLKAGAVKARETANRTLERVRRACGLR